MYAGGMACSSFRNGQQSRPRLRPNYVADPTGNILLSMSSKQGFLASRMRRHDLGQEQPTYSSVALGLSGNNVGRSKQRAGSKYLFYLRKKYSCALIA